MQIIITQIERVDPVDLIPESPVNPATLLRRMTEVLKCVKPGTPEHTLWERFVRSEELLTLYETAPAAAKHHHAYKRGLWEHSICVAENAVPHFVTEEKGIGTVAALLHDIGKVDSYMFKGPSIIFTDAGKMLDHIVLGVMRLQPLLDGLPEKFCQMFLNALVSHHGTLELGSPVVPKTRFAAIILQADMLDSRAAHIRSMETWSG